VELNYKNYLLKKLDGKDKQELCNLFGGLKDGTSVHIINPRYILPKEVLENYNERDEFDFYNILPASRWKDEKLAYLTLHSGFLDSKVSGDVAAFMKRVKADLEYVGDAYRVKNPELNFVAVEDFMKEDFVNARRSTFRHFSMVRGLIKMKWEDGLNVAFNPDYARVKEERCRNPFARLWGTADNTTPDYLFASQKLIDERQGQSRQLHTSVFDITDRAQQELTF
jgi:hypothetical protein